MAVACRALASHRKDVDRVLRGRAERRGFDPVVTVAFTLAATITSIVSVHLLTMPQGRGHWMVAAVATGALLKPSQIVWRGVELAWGRKLLPIASTFISAVLMATVIAAFTSDLSGELCRCELRGRAGMSFLAGDTLPLAIS